MTEQQPEPPHGEALTKLPCAVCGNHPGTIDGDPDVPYAADIFTATGHYGSTRFDPVFGKENLRLLICASCLDRMILLGAIERIKPGTDEEPGSTVIFGSEEDTDPGNPFNRLRLANERAMMEIFGAYPGLSEDEVTAIFEACQESTRRGWKFRLGKGRSPERALSAANV